jgi:hypothetical protein
MNFVRAINAVHFLHSGIPHGEPNLCNIAVIIGSLPWQRILCARERERVLEALFIEFSKSALRFTREKEGGGTQCVSVWGRKERERERRTHE